MPHIGPIPPDFFATPLCSAIGPEVIYVGPMPQRSRDYYDLDRLFWCAGYRAFVYVLLHCDGSTVYVGKASNRPGNRFDKHRRRDWWDAVYNLVLLRVTGSTQSEADALALRLERYAIQKLDPIHNVTHVRPRRGPRGVFA